MPLLVHCFHFGISATIPNIVMDADVGTFGQDVNKAFFFYN